MYSKEDLILVARTSFGKSLIMQILPCLVPESVIIVILPLLALGSEQADPIRRNLSKEGGANSIFVNAKNIGRNPLMRTKTGIYTYILISPELLTGGLFHNILSDPQFRDLVKWVVIDELHPGAKNSGNHTCC
jgi:superfamily II DNA helicase RecQ